MKQREIRSWLMDMDGVLVREEHPIPGAAEFVTRLRKLGAAVPRADEQLDVHAPRPGGTARRERPRGAGGVDLDVGARDRWMLLQSQRPGGTAFAIGKPGC